VNVPRRVLEHVTAPEHDDAAFAALVEAAFAFQYERLAPYRALCDRADRAPGEPIDWRDVPMVPATAFATIELATEPAKEIFRSSGTLGGERSVHRHPYPAIYRAVIDATFPRYALPPEERRPAMLSLVPSRQLAPDSSLAFLIDHVLSHHAGSGSRYGIGARGVELGTCRSWLSGAQRGGRPVVLLTTSYALAELLEVVERIGLRFRLPPGSVVFETGGFKTRRKEISRAELGERLATWLDVAPERRVDEYGMTELTGHAYTDVLAGGEAGRFVLPPWMRVRALDPETLAERPVGERGLLAFFDLANVGSALHVLTEDLGRAEGDRAFRLDGRAETADLRGCSLLAEELAAGA